MRRLARPLIILLALCALALAGCGGDDGERDKASADQLAGEQLAQEALASVRADAKAAARTLERRFAARGYPRDLAGALSAAAKAKVELADGNRIGGYELDRKRREFRLCVENDTTAFAVFDSRRMRIRQSAEAGGCPLM